MMEKNVCTVQSWWRPEGWHRRIEPQAFADVEDFDTAGWASQGYDNGTIFGGEYSSFAYVVEVHEHDDGHLAVILDLPFERWLARFFVEAEHATEFYVEKLPALLMAAAAKDQAAELAKIAKTLISFVRHGHGENVIDEHGEQTIDEQRRESARWMADRIRRERASQKESKSDEHQRS